MESREWIDKTEDKSADTIERCHGFKKKEKKQTLLTYFYVTSLNFAPGFEMPQYFFLFAQNCTLSF